MASSMGFPESFFPCGLAPWARSFSAIFGVAQEAGELEHAVNVVALGVDADLVHDFVPVDADGLFQGAGVGSRAWFFSDVWQVEVRVSAGPHEQRNPFEVALRGPGGGGRG